MKAIYEVRKVIMRPTAKWSSPVISCAPVEKFRSLRRIFTRFEYEERNCTDTVIAQYKVESVSIRLVEITQRKYKYHISGTVQGAYMETYANRPTKEEAIRMLVREYLRDQVTWLLSCGFNN